MWWPAVFTWFSIGVGRLKKADRPNTQRQPRLNVRLSQQMGSPHSVVLILRLSPLHSGSFQPVGQGFAELVSEIVI